MAAMDTTADEIQKAALTLGFDQKRFRRLSPVDAKPVFNSALRQFVPQGDPRWWWEYFPESTSVYFAAADGWKVLSDLVPDADERVWFIAEDDASSEYPVWEASVRDIQAIVPECYFFEYYLIQKQFQWLICENHHNRIIAVGAEVEAKLKKYINP